MKGQILIVHCVAIWPVLSMLHFYQIDAPTSALLAKPACAASQLVFQTLEQAGFAVHLVKSLPVPTQCLVWLGFVIDMIAGQIEVPQSKIVALRELLDCVKQASHVKAKC